MKPLHFYLKANDDEQGNNFNEIHMHGNKVSAHLLDILKCSILCQGEQHQLEVIMLN